MLLLRGSISGALLLSFVAEFCESFEELGFGAAAGGLVVVFFDSEVILVDPAIGRVVGVLVSGTVSEFGGTGVVTIAEVHGDGEDGVLSDVSDSGIDGDVGGVGFWSAGEEGDGLGEVDAAFGHTDGFDGLPCGDSEREGLWFGVADIFGGGDDESSGDEAGIFAGFEHSCEPVEGGIGIASADAFDERAGDVVVFIAIGIKADDSALE